MRLLTGPSAGWDRPTSTGSARGPGSTQARYRPARADVRDHAPDSADTASIVEALDRLPEPGWPAARGRSSRACPRPGSRPCATSSAGCGRHRAPARRTSSERPNGRSAWTSRSSPAPATARRRPGPISTPSPTSPRLHRQRRPPHPRRVPQLARGGAVRGARSRQGLHRGVHGRDPGPHGARRQGPRVGRRRGARASSRRPSRRTRPTGRGGPTGSGGSASPPTVGGPAASRASRTTSGVTATGCPHLDWRTAEDFTDIEARVGGFAAAVGDHGIVEERRLAYVALTRARTSMLLTAAVWSTASTPRVTSRFLTEVIERPGTVRTARPWAPMPDRGRREPPARGSRDRPWSQPSLADEPLAARRTARRALAGAGRAGFGRRSTSTRATTGGQPTTWTSHARGRSCCRARTPPGGGGRPVDLPRHLSTSPWSPWQRTRTRSRSVAAPLARAARPRGPAGHRLPRLDRAALRPSGHRRHPGAAGQRGRGSRRRRRPRAMQANFLASEWAERVPIEVELAVETVIDGIAVRGRVDAVFPREDGGMTVVDWKTGRPPSGAEAAVRASSSRPTGSPTPGCAASTPTASTRPSSTRRPGRPSGPTLPDEARLVEVLRTVPSR